MTLDRYLKAVLTVIALALVALAVQPWAERLAPAPAAAQTDRAEYQLTAPRAWGKIVGFSNGNLLLEAADGTLREVDLRGKPPEYPKVKVHLRWN